MEIRVAEGEGFQVFGPFFFHCFDESFCFQLEEGGEGGEVRPGFIGNQDEGLDGAYACIVIGEMEMGHSPAHVFKFVGKGAGNIEIEVVFHRFFEVSADAGAFFHDGRGQFEAEVDVFPAEVIPYLAACRIGQVPVGHGFQDGFIQGKGGKYKTFAGKRVEPPVHASKDDPGKALFACGPLFIMHNAPSFLKNLKKN